MEVQKRLMPEDIELLVSDYLFILKMKKSGMARMKERFPRPKKCWTVCVQSFQFMSIT